MDKVTVIMPAYNAEKFIAFSVESVLNQTYQNTELLIVNDGSIDNTVGVISEYVKQYPGKIRLINRPENHGTAFTINEAISNADGEYLSWLSADDLYAETMVSSQVDFLKNNAEYDACYSLSVAIDENNKMIGIENRSEDYLQELSKSDSVQPYRRLLQLGNSFHGCSMLGKRQCFTDIEGFKSKYRYAHDYEFWLRFAASYRIGFVRQYNVLGREYEGQISRQGNNEEDAIRAWYDFALEKDLIITLMQKAGYNSYEDCIHDGFANRIFANRDCKREMNVLLDLYKDFINK